MKAKLAGKVVVFGAALLAAFAVRAAGIQRILPLYQIGDGAVLDNDGRITATPSQDGYGYVYAPDSGFGTNVSSTCEIEATAPVGQKIGEWWRYERDPRDPRSDTVGEKMTAVTARPYFGGARYSGGLDSTNAYYSVSSFVNLLESLGAISHSFALDRLWLYLDSDDSKYYSSLAAVKADIEEQTGKSLDSVLDAITGFTWKYTEQVADLQYIVVKYDYTTYTLTYRLGADSGAATDSAKYVYTNEVTIAGEDKFSRAGYTFNAWTNTAGKVFKAGEKATGATLGAGGEGTTVTLWASWSGNPYTVKFDANGGAGTMAAQGFVYGTAQNLSSNAFARTGWTFLGWALSADAAEARYKDGQSVGNLAVDKGATVTLYAVWKANEYKVKYEGNGKTGGSMADGAFTYGRAAELAANKFTRTGWTFTGWSREASGDVEFADGATVSNLTAEAGATVALWAQWEANPYKVAFEANGGMGDMADEPFVYGDAQRLTGAGFERIGYSFAGWAETNTATRAKYGDEALVTNLVSAADGEKTLYAVWTPNTYTIAFEANGADSGEMDEQDAKYGESVKLNRNRYSRTGYSFAGWAVSPLGEVEFSDNAEVANLTARAGGKVTLYAVWKPQGYTVAFEANGGDGEMEPLALDWSQEAELPSCAFSRTGWAFAGWATNGNIAVALADCAVVSNLSAKAGGEVALRAVWTPNRYSVRFRANGGAGEMPDQEIAYGTRANLSANAYAREGYSFAGWLGEDGTRYANSATVSNLTATAGGFVALTAQWAAGTYTVKYSAAGGSGAPGEQTFTNGVAAALSTAVPERGGYDFAGWQTPEGEMLQPGETVRNLATEAGAQRSLTLTAVWNQRRYVLRCDAGGGIGSMPPAVLGCATNSALPDCFFERPGYTFAGWILPDGSTNTTGAVVAPLAAVDGEQAVITAAWTPNKFRVKFDKNGGTGADVSQDFTYGEAQPLKTNAYNRAGFAFGGWATEPDADALYADGEKVANLSQAPGDTVTLYAVWTGDTQTHSISFEANGGVGEMDTILVRDQSSFTLPPCAFAREGYRFAGWQKNGSGALQSSGETVSGVTADAVYAAKWTANKYVIAYDADGGTGAPATQTASFGETVKLAGYSPVRPGYAFCGWALERGGDVVFTNKAAVVSLSAVDGATNTLYAVWEPNTYTVSFGKNGGDGEAMAALPMTYGEPQALRRNMYTREGYSFAGWGRKEGAAEAEFADGAVVSNLTTSSEIALHAVWSNNVFTVHYASNGGTGEMEDGLFAYGGSGKLAANGFSRPGYEFAGWARTPGGAVAAEDRGSAGALCTDAGGAVTLFAVWNAITNTVSFSGGSGASGSMQVQTFVYGSPAELKANAFTRTGYHFAGWTPNPSLVEWEGATYADGQLAGNFSTNRNGSTTLYAVWAPNKYTVEYLPNGGEGEMASETYDYDTSWTLPECRFARVGYVFAGWFKEGTATPLQPGAAMKNLSGEDGATVSLSAVWKPAAYEVAFEPNGAESGSMAAQKFEYGAPQALSSNRFVRVGWTFAGWAESERGEAKFADKEEVGDLAVADGATVTLWAVWERTSWTARFDKNGGSGEMPDQTFAFGESKTLSPNAFTLAGHAFTGWATSGAGDVAFADAQQVRDIATNATVTLYAVWKELRNFSFDPGTDDATGEMPAVATTEDFTVPDCGFALEGCTFAGWATNDEGRVDFKPGDTLKESLELKALWTTNEYTIVFNPNGGAGTVENQDEFISEAGTAIVDRMLWVEWSQEYGAEFALDPALYSRADYELAGWSTNGTDEIAFAADASVSNLTTVAGGKVLLSAVWRYAREDGNFAAAMDCKGLKWENQSGLGGGAWEVQSGDGVGYGGGTSAACLSVINSANDTEMLLTRDAAVGATLVFRWCATWKEGENAPSLAFEQWIGSMTNFVANANGEWQEETVRLSSEGAYFFVAAGQASEGTTIYVDDMRYYPSDWMAVEFDGDGGDGAMSPQEFLSSRTEVLAKNVFTREGYAFGGWTNEAANAFLRDGDTLRIRPKEGSVFKGRTAVELKAVWEELRYFVSFDANGGEGEMDSLPKEGETNYFEEVTLPASGFSREGYEFAGWGLESGATYPDYADGAVVSNKSGKVTLYALWEAHEYEVCFDAAGGDGSMDAQSFVYGEAQALVANGYVRDGYGFAGWVADDGRLFADGETVSNLTAEAGATVTLHAVWEPHGYSVSFEAGGAGGRMAHLDLEYGEETVLPANGFYKTGWAFAGWKAADGRAFADCATVSNLTAEAGATVTLTAQWVCEYELVYVDGCETNRVAAAAGETVALGTPETRTGWTFAGWATSATAAAAYAGGTEVSALTGVGGTEVGLWAVWSPNAYEIRFEPGEGDGFMSTLAAEYDSQVTLPRCIFTNGKARFANWQDAVTGKTYEDGATVSNLASEDGAVVTLQAIWDDTDWGVVAFQPNGGLGAMAAVSFEYGQAPEAPECVFARAGWTFAGWALSSGGAPAVQPGDDMNSLLVAPCSQATLYAAWRPNSYAIRFDAGTGDAEGSMPDVSAEYGETVELPPNTFSLAGATFAGWALAPGGDVAYADMAAVRNLSAADGETVTLYAVWRSTMAEVSFSAPDGAAAGSTTAISAAAGATVTLPEAGFVRKGYTFAGWADPSGAEYKPGDAVTLPPDGLALSSLWTPNAYSVIFNPAGGIGDMPEQQFEYDEPQSLASNRFVRTGFRFAGWRAVDGTAYADAAEVENLADGAAVSAVTLSAVWERNVYAVAFAANGGEGDMDALELAYGRSAELPACGFSYAGHSFAGWLAPDGSILADGALVADLTDEPDATVTLAAQWTPNEYAVCYFAGSGGAGEMEPATLGYGEAAALATNAFVRAGYVFAGWKTEEGDEFADGAAVSNLTADASGSVSLVAQWRPVAYSVEFAANGGAGAMPAQGFVYGEAQPLSTNCFTHVGHSFAGWAAIPGGESLYADGETVANLASGDGETVTLHAVWTPNAYEVRFEADGGEGEMDALALEYGEEFTLPECAFSRDGYAFCGWATNGNGAVAFADGAVVSNLTAAEGATVSLDAVWSARRTTVSFDANGGVGEAAALEFVWGEEQTMPGSDAFMRTGYALAGWVRFAGAGEPEFEPGESVTNLVSQSGALVLYAVWKTEAFEIAYDGGEGAAGEMESNALAPGDAIELQAVQFVRPGWSFAGWATNADAAEAEYEDGAVISNLAGNVTLYAIWTPHSYEVLFAANGGSGTMTAQAFVYGEAQTLASNVFVRAGWSFAGWALSPNGDIVYDDGEEVSNLTAKDGGAIALYAIWLENEPEEPVPPDEPVNPEPVNPEPVNPEPVNPEPVNPEPVNPEPVNPEPVNPEPEPEPEPELFPSGTAVLGEFTSTTAATYNGWLKDASTGAIKGLLTVKTGAVRRAGATSRVTITYTPLSGKKRTLRTTVAPGGNPTDEYGIVYGNLGLAGTFEGLEVEASKDFAKAKVAAEKALVNEMPQGAWTCAFLDSAGAYNLFSVTVAKKGKAKVVGMLADGTRATFSVQGVLGEDGVFAVPVSHPRKGFGFVMWIDADGEVGVTGLAVSGWTFETAGVRANLAAGTHALSFDVPKWRDYLTEVDGYAATPAGDYIITVAAGARKWVVARKVGSIAAASGVPYVKYNAARQTPANLAALRLTYTASSGAVKGSFKLSYLNGTRIKADTVTVSGMVIGSRFIGTGTVRRLGSFPIASEKK